MGDCSLAALKRAALVNRSPVVSLAVVAVVVVASGLLLPRAQVQSAFAWASPATWSALTPAVVLPQPPPPLMVQGRMWACFELVEGGLPPPTTTTTKAVHRWVVVGHPTAHRDRPTTMALHQPTRQQRPHC
jgi:hypothetical protein